MNLALPPRGRTTVSKMRAFILRPELAESLAGCNLTNAAFERRTDSYGTPV